jgi:hypothetical protein
LETTYCQQSPSQEQVDSARAHFDHCDWNETNEDDIRVLSAAPSPNEIKLKLGRAANTAPGRDGLEYRHLRSLDNDGELLATIYRAVWSLGIPACWKTSRTVPIFKKGDTSDYGNFRPISLLPTMYKIFSGIISSRIMAISTRAHPHTPHCYRAGETVKTGVSGCLVGPYQRIRLNTSSHTQLSFSEPPYPRRAATHSERHLLGQHNGLRCWTRLSKDQTHSRRSPRRPIE